MNTPRTFKIVKELPTLLTNGHYLSLARWGDEWKQKLREFLFNPDHQFILHNIEPLLEEPELSEVIRLRNEALCRYGSYGDSLLGFRNMIHNMKEAASFLEFEAWPKVHKAMLVSAGPSLRDHIAAIKTFEGAIFCVDAAYPVLAENGIIPDFVVTAERTDECAVFFEGMQKNDKTVLWANILSHYETIDHWNGEGKMFFFRNMPEIETMCEGRKLTSSTPFVSQTALALMIQMGATDIMTVGLDLVFHPTTGESHAKVFYRENRHQMFKVPTYQGPRKLGLTTPFWRMFAADIEEMLKAHPEVSVFNSTRWAQKIEGVTDLPLDLWIKNGSALMPALALMPDRGFDLSKLKFLKWELESYKGGPRGLSKTRYIQTIAWPLLPEPLLRYECASWSMPEKEDFFREQWQEEFEVLKKDVFEILA